MTLYIIRHGETKENEQRIIQGSGVDSDLNETGKNQSRAFFEAYGHIDFDLVVTSTLKRTHQTAKLFLDRNIPWVQHADINEISWGDQEGQRPSPEQNQQFKALLQAWQSGDLHAALPGGESAHAVYQRVARFLDWIKAHEGAKILVVTHGRTMRCLVTTLKGLTPETMEAVSHSNTCLYLAHYRNGIFEMEMENDTRHLDNL